MKTLLPVLVAVVALAIAVLALMRPAPPAPVPPPAGADPELAALRTEVAELRRDLVAWRDRPAPPAPVVEPGLNAAQVQELVQAELRRQGGTGRGWGEPDPAELQASLRSETGVDEAQAAQVAKLLGEHRAAIRELFRSTSDRSTLPKAMAEAGKRLEEQVAAAVGTERAPAVQEWLRKRDPMRGGMGRRGGGGGDSPPPAGREF
jgi:hypothetical protein